MTSAPISILCRRILAILPRWPQEESDADVLDLTWRQMQQRAASGITRGGRPIRVILPADQCLEHGALLADSGGLRIVANLLPCPVLIIRTASPLELSRTAYKLGNLHVAAQFAPPEIMLPADDATEAAMENLGIPCDADVRLFRPDACGLPRFSINTA